MANRLLDYIEMTEYIPSELREQLTSIRELDLQVHNAMDELEKDIKKFFSIIDTLSSQERQDQYDAFIKKCDVATKAASDKVKVADRLHDLVEKSMRLLDQGLEKLKEDLIEGDKACIVDELERRSHELDEAWRERQRLEQESAHFKLQEFRNHPKNVGLSNGKSNPLNNHNNHNHTNSNNHNIQHIQNSHHHSNHRNKNNLISTHTSIVRQRKRERKRLNSTMTIFNRNSMTEDDSTNQTFLSSPMTPDDLAGMQNSSASINEIAIGNNSNLTIKGMISSNRSSFGLNDKSNGSDPLTKARQPILTAIDAALAVSPKATNSDKLVMISSNANGDINITHNNEPQRYLNMSTKQSTHYQQQPLNQLSNHLISPIGYRSGNESLQTNSAIVSKDEIMTSDQNHKDIGPFSSLPLTSRNDPIIVAASQAINATQNMTPGRRTSSLKASYEAVNSGRLQTAPSQQIFEQGMMNENYCKCRGRIQDPNMIACDNSNCEFEWFHYECVGITTPPEGDWFCESCRPFKDKQGNNKQR